MHAVLATSYYNCIPSTTRLLIVAPTATATATTTTTTTTVRGRSLASICYGSGGGAAANDDDHDDSSIPHPPIHHYKPTADAAETAATTSIINRTPTPILRHSTNKNAKKNHDAPSSLSSILMATSAVNSSQQREQYEQQQQQQQVAEPRRTNPPRQWENDATTTFLKGEQDEERAFWWQKYNKLKFPTNPSQLFESSSALIQQRLAASPDVLTTINVAIATNLCYYNTQHIVIATMHHNDNNININTNTNLADSIVGLDPGIFAGMTAAILGILMVRAAQHHLAAFWTRRHQQERIRDVVWDELHHVTRDLAGNTMMWLSNNNNNNNNNNHENATQEMQQQQRMLYLIKAFPVALRCHLDQTAARQYDNEDDDMNDNGDMNDRWQQRNNNNKNNNNNKDDYDEMLQVFDGDKSNPDFGKIVTTFQKGQNLPLGIISWMRQIIATNHQVYHHHHDNDVSDASDDHYDEYASYNNNNQEMNHQVSRLVGCLGKCERLASSSTTTMTTTTTTTNRPISLLLPPNKSNIAKDATLALYLWSNMLPFAMYESLGLATIPASILVSWAILGGMEHVHQVLEKDKEEKEEEEEEEEPLEIRLPLKQYSQDICSSVNDIRDTYLMGRGLPTAAAAAATTTAVVVDTSTSAETNRMTGVPPRKRPNVLDNTMMPEFQNGASLNGHEDQHHSHDEFHRATAKRISAHS